MQDIFSSFDTNLGANSTSGSAPNMNTPGQYGLTPMHEYLPPRSGGPVRRRPMRRQNIYTSTARPSIASRNARTSPMALETFGEIAGAKWTGVLDWERGDGTRVPIQAEATEMVRDPMLSTWPKSLPLEVVEAGIYTRDIQAWIHKTKAPVARFKNPDAADNSDFDLLVKSLRNVGGYALAKWEMGGQLQARLLLAPFSKDLLCAAFPLGISDLPTSQSQWPVRMMYGVDSSSRVLSQPAPRPSPLPIPTSPEQPYREAAQSTLTPRQPRSQPWTYPEASYCIPTVTEFAQGDPDALFHWDQMTSFAPSYAESPLHIQPRWEDHTQGSSLQPQAQPASLDMGADNEQDSWRTETRAAANSPDYAGSAFPAGGNANTWSSVDDVDEKRASHQNVGFDFGTADAIGSSADSSLRGGGGGGGFLNGTGIYAISTPRASLEVREDLDDLYKYVDWEGNGGGYLGGA